MKPVAAGPQQGAVLIKLIVATPISLNNILRVSSGPVGRMALIRNFGCNPGQKSCLRVAGEK